MAPGADQTIKGPQPRPSGRLWPWNPWLLLAGLAALLFALRLLAPPNLLDQDQERPASYVLDVIRNGNWICQRDWTGDVTSKPPLYTWLCSLVALAVGRVGEFALYLPGALGALGSAWLVYGFGRRQFGERAAFLGGVACMLSSAGAKQIGLARTDGVFAFTVTLAALLAYRSWRSGRGWTWFWLAAAAATLTKGPLGVLLASFGLFAVLWERKSGMARPLNGGHLRGIILYLLICGGWFLLAYWQLGDALVAKMLGKELAGHALSGSKRNLPGLLIYQQPLYYLGRSAPWSLLAYFGLWRLWRQPARETEERAFERFLFCWFWAGLLLFSLAPHQRADLLWPIIPAAASIAGRELDRLGNRWSAAAFSRGFAIACLAGLAGLGLYFFSGQGQGALVRQTLANRELAQTVERDLGREFPLTYVDAPMAFQVDLNTLRTPISAARAAELLRGKDPVYLALSNPDALLPQSTNGAQIHMLYRSVAFARRKAVAIVSNRQSVDIQSRYVFAHGDLLFSATRAVPVRLDERGFVFRCLDLEGTVTVANDGQDPASVVIVLRFGERQRRWSDTLGPGERRVFTRDGESKP